jgi:hypothetical protein
VKYLKKFGRDFDKLHSKIPSKTKEQHRNFFMNNVKKMNLAQFIDKDDPYFKHSSQRKRESSDVKVTGEDKKIPTIDLDLLSKLKEMQAAKADKLSVKSKSIKSDLSMQAQQSQGSFKHSQTSESVHSVNAGSD